jgi:hypothetical protein
VIVANRGDPARDSDDRGCKATDGAEELPTILTPHPQRRDVKRG